MGTRSLHIILVSAESLTRQPPGSRMVVKAEANIINDSRMVVQDNVPVKSTKADTVGDVNPTWNHRLHFNLHCKNGGTTSPEFLHIVLYNTIDRSPVDIGNLQIPLKKFLEDAGEEAMGPVDDSLPVSTGGQLNFSYKLGAYSSSKSRRFGIKVGEIVGTSTLQNIIRVVINKLSKLI